MYILILNDVNGAMYGPFDSEEDAREYGKQFEDKHDCFVGLVEEPS
jgi:hypothetical protein